MRQYGTHIELARLDNFDPVTTCFDETYDDDDVNVYLIGVTIPTNDTLGVTCT